jgi:hypothetical protein
MANHRRQTDDIIRDHQPFIQNNKCKQKTETQNERCLNSAKLSIFSIAFQNDVNSKPKPIHVNINNTIYFNITTEILQINHHNQININKNNDQKNVESGEEDAHIESETDQSGDDEGSDHGYPTPPPTNDQTNDKAT